MPLEVIRIYWSNAAMPFALALMPLLAFAEDCQMTPTRTSSVQIQEYEMATVPLPASLERPTTSLLAAPLALNRRPG
jgi:hypothetical protein